MKITTLIPIVCALGLAGACGSSGESKTGDLQSPAAAAKTIAMKSMSFDPKRLEIQVGDSVVWSNEARTAHTATSDDDGATFDTGEIAAGSVAKPVRFGNAGEYKYHCRIHGRAMSGTIVVGAAQTR